MQDRRASGLEGGSGDPGADAADGSSRPAFDPASLPLPFLSRRRLAQVAGLIVAVWLVIGFGRQVADAAAASTRADDLRSQNAALHDQVSALQSDLNRVQDGSYIQLEGRAYGLGAAREIPFTLEAGAPTPGPTSPGAAAVRLGAEPARTSPLEGWLEALFGPAN